MHSPEDLSTDLLGYRIERDAVEANRYRVLEPDGPRVLAVFDGLPAAERFVVLRELRAIGMHPSHPAY